MPPALLDTQFATLEPPAPDENALVIDIAGEPEAIAEAIITAIGRRIDV
jgi:gluconokinase